MNVVIVDDEPLAIDVLETYIEKVPELNIVAKCTNALDANEIIRKGDVDFLNYLNNWIIVRGLDGWLQERHRYWFTTQDWKGQME